jgi:hypothetical protein
MYLLFDLTSFETFQVGFITDKALQIDETREPVVSYWSKFDGPIKNGSVFIGTNATLTCNIEHFGREYKVMIVILITFRRHGLIFLNKTFLQDGLVEGHGTRL